MKKLLFAAMAAAMASVASAATDYWTFKSSSDSPIYAGYTGKGSSSALLGSTYDVYYISIHQESGAYSKKTASARQDEVANKVLEALRSGKSVGYGATAAGETLLATSTTAGSGLVETKSNVGVDTGLYFKMYNDSTYDVMEVLSVVVAEGNAYIAHNTGSVNNPESQSNYNYTLNAGSSSKILKDSTGEGTYDGFGWYAIPEPTSGLLLLIGMAGLALRRRRA